MKTIRNATKEELLTPIETIPYSDIEKYCRYIEKRNLKQVGHSVSFGSMNIPYGFITIIDEKNNVEIHTGWKKVLKDLYWEEIN